MNQTSHETLKTLRTYRNEMEANEVVNILESHGIQAKAVGGFTANFNAGGPGAVNVLVLEHSLAEAQELLREFERTDDSDDADPMDESLDSHPDAGTTNKGPWFILLANLAGLGAMLVYYLGGNRSQNGFVVAFIVGAAIVMALGWVNRQNQNLDS